MHRLTLMFLFFLALAQADTLVLRDGNSMAGSWLGGDAQTIRFLVGEQVRSFRKSDVRQVVFGDAQSAPPSTRVDPPPPPPPAAFEQVADGMRFRLERCERHSTDSVTCFIAVESLLRDIQMRLGIFNTFIVDSGGIKQIAQAKTLGSSEGSEPNTLAVQNVPVRGELRFAGVEPSVNRISLLSLEYNLGPAWRTVTYRNVPLQGN